MLLSFAAVWYASLLRTWLNGTINGANGAIFLLGGALPLYAAYIKGRTALACCTRSSVSCQTAMREAASTIRKGIPGFANYFRWISISLRTIL